MATALRSISLHLSRTVLLPAPLSPRSWAARVGMLRWAGIANAAATIVIPEQDVVPATAVLHSDGLDSKRDPVSRRGRP